MEEQISEGIYWATEFYVQHTPKVDGGTKFILMKRQEKRGDHEKDGGIVLDMLSVFDVIGEVHCQSRHLGQANYLGQSSSGLQEKLSSKSCHGQMEGNGVVLQ